MSVPIIITFSGQAQHGKTSAANILKSILENNDQRVLLINYADQLKYIAKQYFGWDGQKSEKGRTLLQVLGTDKIRRKFPNYWVDRVIEIVELFSDDFDFVLIADCRFPNEITRWNDNGYSIFTTHVYRPNFDNGLTIEQKNHPSETALNDQKFVYNLIATNLEELENEINKKMMRTLEKYYI